jgi:hypothetical protein
MRFQVTDENFREVPGLNEETWTYLKQRSLGTDEWWYANDDRSFTGWGLLARVEEGDVVETTINLWRS